MPTVEDELAEVAASASKSLFSAMGSGLWAALRASVSRMLSRRRRSESTPPGAEPSRASDRLAAVHQQNTAHDSGRIYATQHGTQHVRIHERQEPK